MKTKWMILVSVLFLTTFSYAQNKCESYLSQSVDLTKGRAGSVASSVNFSDADVVSVKIQKQPEPIRLSPGDTVWGYYECSNCSTEVSAKPGERKCVNCGKPHSDEPLDEIAPAVFRKNGALYLVNPGRLSSDRAMDNLAKTGVADECPFCGTTDFDLSVGCKSCGAQTDNVNDIRKYALNKRKAMLKGTTRISSEDTTMAEGRNLPPLNEGVMAKADLKGPTVTEIETQLELINAENEGRRPRVRNQNTTPESAVVQKRRFLSRLATKGGALALAASTLMVGTPIGYIWGTTDYTRMAEVVSVSSSNVVVEYYKPNGQLEDISLKRNQNESTWHIGEQIELYFVNWKLGAPSGGERGNGDVLRPEKNDTRFKDKVHEFKKHD